MFPQNPLEKTKPKKKRRNWAQREFFEVMIPEGWEMSKKAFPDVICRKKDRIIFVCIRNKRSGRVKREQNWLLNYLAQLGADCYIWNPPNVFLKIQAGLES